MRIIMHVATPQRLSLTESSSMPAARYPQRHEPVQHLGGPLAFDLSGSGDGLRGDWIAMCTELCLQGTIFLVRLSEAAGSNPACQTEQKQACAGKKNGIGRNFFRCRFP